MSTFSLTTSAPAKNLQRLLMIRGVFLLVVCFSLAFSYWQWNMALAYAPMLWIISGLTLINIVTLAQMRWQPHIPASTFVAQLLIDILGISLLLYFSGGADNPFVSYYLVPLCIAAATLNWRAAWPLMLFSLVCYTLLFFYRIPLPDIAPHALQNGHAGHTMGGHSGSSFSAHTVGMWFNFLISAGLITFFVVRMADSLRRQNDTLTQLKEDRLHDEQLLAVATLAAGTSHELSTPLTTLKTLLHEMLREQSHNPSAASSELISDLELLQSQVDHCTDTLSHLREQASHWNDKHQAPQPLQQYCHHLIDNWLLMRPEANADIHYNLNNPDIKSHFHPAISHAILNVLNNAADANPKNIEIQVQWDNTELVLIIRDHGKGIDPKISNNLGAPFNSEKGEGRGLGLFLTQATLNRHKGQITLENHVDGGTRAVLTLPITPAH